MRICKYCPRTSLQSPSELWERHSRDMTRRNILRDFKAEKRLLVQTFPPRGTTILVSKATFSFHRRCWQNLAQKCRCHRGLVETSELSLNPISAAKLPSAGGKHLGGKSELCLGRLGFSYGGTWRRHLLPGQKFSFPSFPLSFPLFHSLSLSLSPSFILSHSLFPPSFILVSPSLILFLSLFPFIHSLSCRCMNFRWGKKRPLGAKLVMYFHNRASLIRPRGDPWPVVLIGFDVYTNRCFTHCLGSKSKTTQGILRRKWTFPVKTRYAAESKLTSHTVRIGYYVTLGDWGEKKQFDVLSATSHEGTMKHQECSHSPEKQPFGQNLIYFYTQEAYQLWTPWKI